MKFLSLALVACVIGSAFGALSGYSWQSETVQDSGVEATSNADRTPIEEPPRADGTLSQNDISEQLRLGSVQEEKKPAEIESMNVTIGNPEFRRAKPPSASSDDVGYSVKVPVTNGTSQYAHVVVGLQAVDKKGLELEWVELNAVAPPLKTIMMTSKVGLSPMASAELVNFVIKSKYISCDKQPGISVSGVDVRITEGPDASGYVWISIEAGIVNRLLNVYFYDVQLQAIDSEGYELKEVFLNGVIIALKRDITGKRTVLTEKHYMHTSELHAIHEWRILSYSYKILPF